MVCDDAIYGNFLVVFQQGDTEAALMLLDLQRPLISGDIDPQGMKISGDMDPQGMN